MTARVSSPPTCHEWRSAEGIRGDSQLCSRVLKVQKAHTSKKSLCFKPQLPVFLVSASVLQEVCLPWKWPCTQCLSFIFLQWHSNITCIALALYFYFIFHKNVQCWYIGRYRNLHLDNWKDIATYTSLKPDSISHNKKKKSNISEVWSIPRDASAKGPQFCPLKGKERTNS